MSGIGKWRLLVRHERMEDDFGLGLPRTWKATGKLLWVGVETLSGSETLVAHQIESKASHVLTTHFTKELRTGDRLVGLELGEVFNITHIENPQAMNRELRLSCTEVVQS